MEFVINVIVQESKKGVLCVEDLRTIIVLIEKGWVNGKYADELCAGDTRDLG